VETVLDDTTGGGEGTEIPGRWVVLGMFAFAVMVTGSIYVYWNLHTAPFRPLQEALAAEYDGSHPLVQGGQRKMHKGTPKILRVTLRVEFDPEAEENSRQAEGVFDRILELAEENLELSSYEVAELHLVHLRPEQEPQMKQLSRELTENGKTRPSGKGD
jgi:hypothetical protein